MCTLYIVHSMFIVYVKLRDDKVFLVLNLRRYIKEYNNTGEVKYHENCIKLLNPRNILSYIKGTVSRDFLLLVFFMNQFPPSPRVSH